MLYDSAGNELIEHLDMWHDMSYGGLYVMRNMRQSGRS